MQLGFVHFDRNDQKKYLAVLSKITEGGAIDELGVGRIRDYYSDLMFPGISSLHQHAKYFSLMPQLYRAAVIKGKFSHLEDVRPFIRKLEIEMTKRLCERSHGASGITGSDSLRYGKYVKYDPMYIYGMALQTFGIVKTENLEEAIFYASKKYHERPVKLSASDKEQGDSDYKEALLSLCVTPCNLEHDWLTECSLDLTQNESFFIRRCILKASDCKNSLLHYILENRIVLEEETFESFGFRYRRTLPDNLYLEIKQAVHFSDLVDGLFLYYNWLFSAKEDKKVYARFKRWYETVFLREQNEMLESVFNVRINDNGSVRFCVRAINLIGKNDWANLDTLVKSRERSIKGTRFKIGNEKGGYHYNPDAPIHDYKVEFRWKTVVTLVNEILGGLGNE